MEALTLEIYLQALVLQVTQLTAHLFVLACYVWPLAIWGAFIIDY